MNPTRLAPSIAAGWKAPPSRPEPKAASATKKVAAVRRSIERLIDSYQDGYLEKGEFEPRIRGCENAWPNWRRPPPVWLIESGARSK